MRKTFKPDMCRDDNICVGAWLVAFLFVSGITFLLGFEIKAGRASAAVWLLFPLFAVYTIVLILSLLYLIKKLKT